MLGNRLDPAKLRRALLWATPGQFDAGFASLATFATGLVAVRDLSTEALAAYALLASAYRVMNQFPLRVIFNPSEVLAIDLPRDMRLGTLRHSIPRGSIVSIVSSLLVPLGALTIASDLSGGDLVALSLSAASLGMVSPIQDHLRQVLHMSSASWVAAAVSGTNLLVTAALLIALDVPAVWLVFGSMAVGNLVSLLVAWVWVARKRAPAVERPGFRDLWALGGWLLLTGLGKTGIRYAVNASLAFFAGVAALGFVEAARIVSQPIRVFSQGVMTQLGPWLTEAAARHDLAAARRWSRRFLVLLGAASLPYLAITATPWVLNPFASLAPRAYEVPWLVALEVVVVVVAVLVESLRLQLLGGRMQKTLALVTFIAGGVELIGTTAGGTLGAYAAPFAGGIASLFALIWFSTVLRRFYRITV